MHLLKNKVGQQFSNLPSFFTNARTPPPLNELTFLFAFQCPPPPSPQRTYFLNDPL